MINYLSGMDSTAAALNAERVRMDVISENIANVNTTRGVDGKAYQRQQVVFESVLADRQAAGGTEGARSVQVARVEKDPHPPHMLYSPNHPDANAQGMVAFPNVDLQEEMVDMIASSRAFEANLSVVKNSRAMAMQTLAIGKH